MSRSKTDRFFGAVFGLSSLLATVIVLAIGFFLCLRSWPAITEVGFRMASDSLWDPAQIDGEPSYGLLPMLVGSCIVTLGACLIAAPTGIAISIFSQYFAWPFAKWVCDRVLFIAAAIPSVVFGFWGLVFLVPTIASFQPPGTSLLAGILIVALMILPTISVVCSTAFREVNQDHIHAAVHLGMGRWCIVQRIIIPEARRGIVVAVLMGITRAIGETMAVVMVCGNISQIPSSVFQPVRCLTANIALEMGYALEFHQSVLFFSATLLLVFSFVLVVVVHWFSEKRSTTGLQG